MNIEPQHLIDNHLYDPLKEALACTAMSTKVGETNTHQATFIVYKPYVRRGTSLA